MYNVHCSKILIKRNVSSSTLKKKRNDRRMKSWTRSNFSRDSQVYLPRECIAIKHTSTVLVNLARGKVFENFNEISERFYFNIAIRKWVAHKVEVDAATSPIPRTMSALHEKESLKVEDRGKKKRVNVVYNSYFEHLRGR